MRIFFLNNDEKVLFLLVRAPGSYFMFCSSMLNLTQHSILIPFQQLMIALIRLRLGLSGQDLACCLRVSSATISRTFTHVIDV